MTVVYTVMMNTTRVWIVVPVFNRAESVFGFIRQILSQSYGDFRLILVDHGTTPVDHFLFDDVRIIWLRESSDLWWTGAANAGLRHVLAKSTCEDDLILLINDDVRLGSGYLQSLMDAAALRAGTIIGSTCVSDDTEKVLYAGFSLDRLRARFVKRHVGRTLEEIRDLWLPTDVLPGRGMLVPVRIFREIGLLDEARLPHYAADDEFSWRAKQRGFDLVVNSECVVRTAPRTPPIVKRSTTLRDFMYDTRRPGNWPTVLAFASSCFAPPYAWYYVGVNFARCLFSYGKRYLANLRRGRGGVGSSV